MTALLAALMLLCGVPLGFIVGLVIGTKMYRGAVRKDEFDGGYEVNNPPVRTLIWSKDIETK